MMQMDKSVNVFGEPLVSCGDDPVTGFFRDGKCNTCTEDAGSHTVCIEVTVDFLEYSRSRGNDLSTSVPEYGFVGLKPGNSWCLCAARWLEAHQEGIAPRVHLTRTHIKALEILPMEYLKLYAADLN
jgi:uncharacterized protein (DUF2237 family)